MRWLLFLGGGLVALVVLVTLIGVSLPRAHVATRAARLPATPDALWTLLTDVAAYPSWRPDVTSVELLPARDGQPAWREVSRHGRVAYAIAAATAPTRLTTAITDLDLPYGGSW